MKPLISVLSAVLVGALACTSARSTDRPVAVVGGTLVDVARGELVPDALVTFEGERILYAGPAKGGAIPAGATILQARGKYLLPGLADMHNHLANGTFEPGGPPADHDRNLRCMLKWGFTTVYSPGLPLNEVRQLHQAAQADPHRYPNFRTTGPPITAPGGHGAHKPFTPASTEEARRVVHELHGAGADAVKVVYTDLSYVTTHLRPVMKRDVMAAIIDEAHGLGLKVYVHAPVLRYAKEALLAGADGMAHGIVSEPVDPEFIALMKKNNAFYMPTHSIFYSAAGLDSWARRVRAFDTARRVPQKVLRVGLDPSVNQEWNGRWDKLEWLRAHLEVMRQNLRAVHVAGVPVILGSDTSESGTGTLLGVCSQMELQLMAEAGLTPLDTLRTATVQAARMLGRESDIGSIETGKLADILVLDANPLEDVGNIRKLFRVIKGGHVHDPAELRSCP